MIAVHAGLERGKNVGEQLEFLKARDTRVPKVTDLSGRKDVWDIPEVMNGSLPMTQLLSIFDIVFFCRHRHDVQLLN